MSTTPLSQDDELARIVAEGSNGSRRSRYWRWAAVAAVLPVALVAWLAMRPGSSGAATAYRSEGAVIGDLTVTVSATGNLQPTNQVDVGSEVSGLVETGHRR